MDSILITGATGFIGSNFAKNFSSKRKVICLSRKNNFKQNSIIFNHKNIIWENYNPLDSNNISRIIDKHRPKEIIHSAGLINGSKKELEIANKLSTYYLVEAIKNSNVSPILIFISSVSSILKTNYGESKLKSEKEILKYKNNKLLILRLSMVYGKGNKSNLYLFEKLLKKYPIIPVPYSKEILLQPLFVDDITQIISSFIKGNGKNRTAYTVSGPDRLNLLDIVRILKSNSGNKGYLIPVPLHLIKKIINSLSLIPWMRKYLPLQQLETIDSQPKYNYEQTELDFNLKMTPFSKGVKLYKKGFLN